MLSSCFLLQCAGFFLPRSTVSDGMILKKATDLSWWELQDWTGFLSLMVRGCLVARHSSLQLGVPALASWHGVDR